MSAPRLNSRSGKMIQMFPDFSAGLNTIGAVHQVDDEELVMCMNVDLDEHGSVSKRKGYTKLPFQPTGVIKGLYAFRLRTARHFMAVAGGGLHRYDVGEAYPETFLTEGLWVRVPIRMYKPGNVKAVLDTNNSSHTANATYEYKVVAKDTSGTTTASDPNVVSSTNVSRVTQGATPKKVILTWDKSLGGTSYEVYRALVTAGVAGSFLKLHTVGDVATWTDDGTLTPAAGQEPPVTNTTSYTLTDQDASFVAWNDRLYLTTGNGLIVWSGTGDAKVVAPYYPTTEEISLIGANAYTDTSSSLHKCKHIKIHWDRMFLCGDSEYPQNAYFTDLGLSPAGGEYAYFPGSFGFDVTTENNEPVTGVSKFRDTLVFFTRGSIHTLFGKQPYANQPEAFDLRLTNDAVGCESHKSIATVHNSLVFANKLGIYALVNVMASDRDRNVVYLSQKIEPTVRKLKGVSKAVAVFHDHQYKISFPEEGVVLRWYVDRQAWTLDHSAQKFTQYLLWDTDLYQSTEQNIYKMGNKRGPSFEEPVYNDDGEPINFEFRSKSFDMRALVNLKKYKTLHIMTKQFGTTSSVHVDVVVDYVTQGFDFDLNESSTLGSWILGEDRLGWVDVVFQDKPCRAKGHQIYFVVSNNKLDEPVTMYGIGMEYKVKKA